MAHELGLFRKFDLKVLLQRELGWATVRDKIVYGELDAAHALAAMPLATSLGLGAIRCDCITALVLSLNGNGITVSNELFKSCFSNGGSLLLEVRRTRHVKALTFGVVAPFSSHRHLLRKWLSAQSIDPDHDVRIVVVPPPQMVANLRAGHLDGFCVGEPWNSVAAAARVGMCIATSEQLDAGHPEKVLMVRRDFADRRAQEHLALVAALLEASEWCAAAANHEQLIATLARPEYVDVPITSLRHGVEKFCVFPDRTKADPSGDKAAWTLELMRASGVCSRSVQLDMTMARRAFRIDLFDRAVRLLSSDPIATHYETLRT